MLTTKEGQETINHLAYARGQNDEAPIYAKVSQPRTEQELIEHHAKLLLYSMDQYKVGSEDVIAAFENFAKALRVRMSDQLGEVFNRLRKEREND
jgi:hypothetical protein